MNFKNIWLFAILITLCHASFIHSSDAAESTDSETDQFLSSPEPEVTSADTKNFIQNIFQKQSLGAIIAAHGTTISISSDGIKHGAYKKITFEKDNESPLEVKNEIQLPHDSTEDEIELFNDLDKPKPQELIDFYNQPIEHPAICENEILELIAQSDCKPENRQPLLKILLGQQQGIIFCYRSIHNGILHSFFRKNDNSHRFHDVSNPEEHDVSNPEEFVKIKTFIKDALINILTKKTPGKINSRIGTIMSNDEHDRSLKKTIIINYQNNAGHKNPLHISILQKPSTLPVDQSFKHSALLSENELVELMNEMPIIPSAYRAMLNVLTVKQTGAIECAEDIHGTLFTTTYRRNSDE